MLMTTNKQENKAMSTDLTERPAIDGDLLEKVQYGSPTDLVADGATVQQVRANHVTAVSVQQPRALKHVKNNIMVEAGLAGTLFYYGWGAGKNKIEGPSIKMALALARCWGNCAVEMRPMQDAGDSWVMTATFIDLETGFTVDRQFRQSKKSEVFGKHDAERKDDIRFQIGQSKAQRNVIINALPDWLVAAAMQEAKKGVLSQIEQKINAGSLAAVVDDALKALAKEGVTEERVCLKFEVAAKTALTAEHLVTIVADLKALQEGHDLPSSVYPDPNEIEGRSRVRKVDIDKKPKKSGKKGKPVVNTEDPPAEPQTDAERFEAENPTQGSLPMGEQP
jgi:hypothetical protein